MPRKQQSHVERNIALCYVRQSFTRNENDMNSPQRQKANIEEYCRRNGFVPEWYEDAEGHKSGRYVKNRPAWQDLEKRISAPEVVAIVTNDQARLHRRMWRMGYLMDLLDEYGVRLVFAEPGRDTIDSSTPQGRMMITLMALNDEAYATDISQRAKASIQHRKRQGKTVGMPPFGTVRNETGYLVPSQDGAWYMPDGKFRIGNADQSPQEGAIWRSYYECARYVLSLFAEDKIGLEKIAYRLNNEGWPFRDRKGKPRRVNRDDIRRIVANWQEYAGMAPERKAKDRPAYEPYNVKELPLVPERAVFDLELLRRVGAVRQQRSFKRLDHGVHRNSRFYPLSVVSYCAHCWKQATERDDPGLRTTLTGWTEATGITRYRHKPGVTCGTTNRSITRAEYEHDFQRLIQLLTIDPSALPLLTELAVRSESGRLAEDEIGFQNQKQEAIALCKRRIDAAVNLYGEGMIDYEDYTQRVERNRREIAHWEARTTETQRLGLELETCMKAVNEISRLWDISNDEERQGLVRSLFEYIIYDLDKHRIVDFRLHPWADRFIKLRVSLYSDGDGPEGQVVRFDDEEKQKYSCLNDVQGMNTEVPHRGFEPLFWP